MGMTMVLLTADKKDEKMALRMDWRKVDGLV
jgi:hypothetical protein